MKFFKKTLLALFILIGFTMVVLSLLANHTTTNLLEPPRRTLQDYHANWLDTPADQGVQIEHIKLYKNMVPCLVVNPAGKPAKRGLLLRKQLTDRKIALPEFGIVTGQLVLLHGRSGRKEDMLPVAERFCAMGIRCLIPDMPKHGDNQLPIMGFGTATGEDQLIYQVFKESIQNQLMNEQLPTSILGISMGGAYAIKTTQQNPIWKSITILCSFDSLESVIDNQSKKRLGPIAPIFSSLVKKRAEWLTDLDLQTITPERWAAEIEIPALVIHGTADKLISLQQGKRLHQAFASTEKKWLEVPAAGHSNILTTPMQVFAEIGEWITTHHSP